MTKKQISVKNGGSTFDAVAAEGHHPRFLISCENYKKNQKLNSFSLLSLFVCCCCCLLTVPLLNKLLFYPHEPPVVLLYLDGVTCKREKTYNSMTR